jgi:hypothetical protein
MIRSLRSLGSRMSWLFRRSRVEADLNAELQDYVERQTERYLASGLSAEEACLAALRDVGGIEQLKEECRDVRAIAWFESALQDLRYGWRALSRSPLFTAMAVLSLALGIGANTAIYGVMDVMMLRALPVRNPGELVVLNWRAKRFPDVVRSNSGNTYDEPGGGKTSPDFPWPVYELFRNHNNVFSTLFAYKDAGRLNLVACRSECVSM